MRRHLNDSWSHRFALLTAAAVVVLLLFPLAATAAPPANDNRAAAQQIPTFPAALDGTTVEATVERLDPQVSDCGSVESTVWYRIDLAPDGTVVLDVSGAGFAPVLRVYEVGKSAIDELVCSSAKAGGTARVGFETTRGASYLVLVGKKPKTADAAFKLNAQLVLPPANDTSSQAKKLGKLPASAKGSTLGATSSENDPDGCRLSGNTVWYSVAPAGAERLIVRLQTTGGFDAVVAVIERYRSEANVVGCAASNARGAAVLPVPVSKGAGYLIVVGTRGNSWPGEFALGVVRAQGREVAPGKPLVNGQAHGTLNGLTNVNDMWWTSMQPGSTYRIALSSKPCVSMTLGQKGSTLRALSCSGYTTFTPGPDGGGKYVFELRAPSAAGSAGYVLRVAVAGVDDVGVGAEIENLSHVHGSLAPAGVDVVDVFHFDVAERSDVRLLLTGGGSSSIVLLTDSGSRIGSSEGQISRQLDRGRYVVAVRGVIGAAPSHYTLGLVIRRLTATTLTASATEVTPGTGVTLTIVTTPRPDTGRVKLQIDRFDPLGGWQFYKIVNVAAGSTTLSWTPPALGRWRVRATFTGTLTFSPSRSGYALLLVAAPLPPATASGV
jgi:hypothetical protein